ncbi:MAG: hypothetical protein ABIS86_03555 [Streptosporangiaceae bacterium]
MTPGTLVLLGSPLPGGLADALRTHRLQVVATHPAEDAGPRYVAGVALAIGATAPTPPLVLVATGLAGPLLPAVAAAQRAAHRLVGGYVFIDTDLPTPAGDWPDAPCGYLSTLPADERARRATIRGWSVAETEAGALPDALRLMIASL